MRGRNSDVGMTEGPVPSFKNKYSNIKEMKTRKYILTVLTVAAGVFMTSCSDFLDKEYDASLSDEKTFGDETETRGFLANIYTNLPDGFAPLSDDQFTGASRDCMTDNAVTYWGLHYYTKIALDGYTAADHPLLGFWNTDLYGIRKCNQFMKNARIDVIGNETTQGDDSKLYERNIAEAKLLRAIFHFDLICWFGACPIIAEDENGTPIVFDFSNPGAMNMERTPAAEALEWVAAQCDLIKDVLPFRYSDETSNWGRVNGAAAYALKARALLYRASPLYNSSNDKALWQKAADAALDLINMNNRQANPYRLYSTGHPEKDSYDLFTEAVPPTQNPEFILARSVWDTNTIEKVFLPCGFTGQISGNGRTNPTQNFVDCFEMANGKHIDEAGSGYDDQHPYSGRDPRLSQIVFYHGMTWGRADQEEQRQLDMSSNAGAQGIDYHGTYGGTYTGYYLKKFVNNVSFKAPSTFKRSWPIFRYTEVLLNAAEALNEAQGPDAAYTYINEIRRRAGMPELSGMTQEQLRERIRNERRIELSFEDHRFFDLRRWKAYEGVTLGNETGKPRYEQLLNIYGTVIRGTDVLSNPQFIYGKAETVDHHVFNSPKNYYFPIPANEVKRAPRLGQNPGWETTSSTTGGETGSDEGSTGGSSNSKTK